MRLPAIVVNSPGMMSTRDNSKTLVSNSQRITVMLNFIDLLTKLPTRSICTSTVLGDHS